MGRKASDLIIVASTACWAACTTLLAVQLLDLGNPDCYRANILLWVCQIGIPPQFLVGGFSIKWDSADDAPPASDTYPHGIVGTILRVARCALLLLPFVFLMKPPPHDVCNSNAVLLPLIFVVVQGHAVICLLMPFACTSYYRGFADPHSHPYYYKFVVSSLSLLLVLLSDLYLSLRSREASQPPLPQHSDSLSPLLLQVFYFS